MYRVLVFCADFEAILTPFIDVIRNGRLSFQKKENRRHTTRLITGQTTLHKSLSPQKEKSRITMKPTVP